MSPSLWVLVVGLGIAFGSVMTWGKVLDYFLRLVGVSVETDSREKFVSDAAKWMGALSLVAFVVFVEHRSLGSVGLHILPIPELLLNVLISLTILLLVADLLIGNFVTPLVERLGLETFDLTIEDLIELPLSQRVFLVITAGVTEQLLFFGYPIERLTALTGNVVLAGTLAVLFFALAHYRFWGLGGVIQIGTKGVFLAGLYVWYRNLVILIIAHALNDFIGTVVYPLIAGGTEDQTNVESFDSTRSDVD